MMHTVKSFFGMVDAETKRRVATFTDKSVEVSSNGVIEVKSYLRSNTYLPTTSLMPRIEIVFDGDKNDVWCIPFYDDMPDPSDTDATARLVDKYAEKIVNVVREMTKEQ